MRSALFIMLLSTPVVSVGAPGLALVGSYSAGAETTEIVVVHAASARAFVTSSADGFVDVLSLRNPVKPLRERRIQLVFSEGDDLTGLAVHPSGEYLLLTVERPEPARGRVEFRATADGRLLGQVEVGVGPDAVAVSADGRWALVCNEAENFFFDPKARRFSSTPGSLTVLDLSEGPTAVSTRDIALSDLGAEPGITTAAARRRVERVVDLDGSGRQDSLIDLNGDGDTEDSGVLVGTLNGVEVILDEGEGEEIELPLTGTTPDLLEPEYAVFNPDGRTAWVVLQENNALLLVDVPAARVLRVVGLGTTTHAADLTDDDQARFEATLVAAREPDGIALTPDGRFLVTADEGDTDPKASKTKAGMAAGGGRTLSVFDAVTGAFIADTGDGIDRMAAARGTYPDARSPNKGSEPEMVTTFLWQARTYAAVSLERADSVALVDLTVPTEPAVVAVAPIDRSEKAGKVAPEGIAHFAVGGRVYVYTANEKRGTVSVFEVTPP